MTFDELKAAALGDAHRENYSAHIVRFTAEAEALIFSLLNAYGLETTLTDVDRVVVGEHVYNLPTKLIEVRHAFYADRKLDQTDETSVAVSRTSTLVTQYCVRPKTIAFAGIPATGAEIELHYWGMPAALVNGSDTNTLLNEYPQLYKRAIHISIYERAKDFQSKQDAEKDVKALTDEINRKVKKQLGGARAYPAYNVKFRSSY